MWRIFRFLGRFGNFLLFLFLELVSLVVIITVNQKHNAITQGMFLEMSGSLADAQKSVYGYFNLRSENQKLQDRAAELESQLLLLKDSLDVVFNRTPRTLSYVIVGDSVTRDSCLMEEFVKLELPDSLMPVSRYKFIPAVAVNNTVDLNYNYITLNKGRNHGVVMDMGVISPEGIAGQVVEVSANYSLALSVLNKKFHTSAKLLRGSNVGTLEWEGGNPEFALLKYIPQTSIINKGDTVVTSGYGTLFTKDYMVGTVDSYNMETQDGFFAITIKLATNFRGLHNVFLVKPSHKTEIDSLEAMKPASQ
jgi:rod shape-determining protein MreC